MRTLNVELGERAYPIHIGRGLLSSGLLASVIRGRQVLVVTNDRIAPLYLEKVLAQLSDFEVATVILPDGENHKQIDTLDLIFSEALERRFSRNATMIALGGGVVGDMVGFAAATYQRGIDFVQIPTTLLSQVDSSVGGKTGVNHRLGKNMIGAFHQPVAVLIDTDVLATLPANEMSAGMAEVIKYGLLGDEAFLTWIEDHLDALMSKHSDAISTAIEQSCQMKAEIVARDEREGGEITKTTLSSGDDGYVSKDWKVFSTSNANITFGGKLKASLGSKINKTSLILKTCTTATCAAGEITFDDKVGFEFIDKDMLATDAERENSGVYSNLIGYNKDNLYRLDVNANIININANIMTWEEQIYRGPVEVGSNDASNTKFAVSVDPAVTFLGTVSDSGAAGTHTLVIRAIKLPSGSIDPKINFNIDNIGNLAKFDPYALSLTNNNALSLNIGDFGSYGNFSGTVAGYAPVGGLRNSAYIVTYVASSVSSSSDRSANIIKALTRAGNSNDILDFFKNLGQTNKDSGKIYSKSIEVFTGADTRRGVSGSSSSSQEKNSSIKENKNSDDKGSLQCSEGSKEIEINSECKNI